MRNLLHEPKRILGLKPATLRDIIIIVAIVSLIAFVAVSAKAETTQEVVQEQVAIHQENTEEIAELKKRQREDEEFIKAQANINKLEAEWREMQEIIHTVREIQEEIKK